MDADALRMLADLGLERRDIVSAPDEIPKAHRVREDPREQAAVAADFEARRLRNRNNDGGEGDERATRLTAWNTETTFETDEVTSQLENRWSGQGHRAGLNRQRLNRDDPWEAIDAQFGEERRLYLQETGAVHSNYAASPPTRSGQDRFKDDILGGNPATPRSFSNGRRRRDRDRGAPPPRAPAHARAPSPRRFGTVRFGLGGHRAEANVGGARIVVNPGLQAAAALREAAARMDAATQPDSNAMTALAPKAAGDDPTQAASRASSAPDPQVATKVHPSATGGNKAPQPSSATTKGLTPNTASGQDTKGVTKHSSNEWAEQVYFNRAIWYAAHPDTCDECVKKDPKTLPYIGRARDELIRDAMGLASQDDEEKIKRYITTHPERTWMVEAGKKAKLQVEQDTNDQILEYCATHPRQMVFVRAAMAVFAPNRDPAITQQRPATASSAIVESPVLMETTSAEAEKCISEETADTSGIGSGSSDTQDSVDTGTSTPPPQGIGTLIAAFFDAAGKFLGTHHAPANVPVYTTINVKSRARHFDPRGLIGAIDVLAQSMVNHSHGLEGVRLTDDGLWVDEEI